MRTAITICNLSKSFVSQSGPRQRIRALKDFSMEVTAGEIMGILGPNGAGKTTLLNILSTLLIPDEGQIEILGIRSCPRNYYHLRTLLNMSSGHPNFPWSLSVRENLLFYGRLYGLKGAELKSRVEELINDFSLIEFADRRFDELSSGTKQRLSLAKALINRPKILFLDEPTIGLDPDVAAKTREVILKVIRQWQMTVLFTTHNMPEAELMCRRIAFVNKGELINLATPEQLKSMLGKKDLEEVFIDLKSNGIKKETIAAAYGEKSDEGHCVKLPRSNIFDKCGSWLNRVFAFTFRNTIFAIRNVFAFVELVFWPVVSLLSIGLMGDFLGLREHVWNFVMTGAITAGVLQVAQLDVAYSLLYEVWSKSVKHTFLTPVGVAESLFGSWVTGIVRGLAIFFILTVAAGFFFSFKLPDIFSVTIFLVGIFCNSFLLGMLVTFLILIFGQKAEITAWMFAYLFMMLCGIYYPVETLPKAFYIVAQFFPMTYFLEYFRVKLGFPPSFSHLLAKGFGLIVIYLILGLNFLRFAMYKARQNGTIVRLSE
ncbi:MAG: ABC transporter ATP-binding protein/permease [Candidatus Omnitrophica bacterium]|nr:ABC transporter ATP-binding protein/permease [Candidatus Omnitrophota bacterium]